MGRPWVCPSKFAGWLWQRAVTVMHHWMARCRRGIELRDGVQSIPATSHSCWLIAENCQTTLSRAGRFTEPN